MVIIEIFSVIFEMAVWIYLRLRSINIYYTYSSVVTLAVIQMLFE